MDAPYATRVSPDSQSTTQITYILLVSRKKLDVFLRKSFSKVPDFVHFKLPIAKEVRNLAGSSPLVSQFLLQDSKISLVFSLSEFQLLKEDEGEYDNR